MFLKIGMTGVAIENLQKNLNQLGAKLLVDGEFGPKTQAAVLKFQSDHNLKTDGVVGPVTQSVLAQSLIGQIAPPQIGETPWMKWMRSHLGEKEIAGLRQNNPFIVALFKHTTYKTDTDETPWCAACVCTALEENGFKSTHNAAAISYKDYGTPCDLIPGCIVVMQHPNGGHHVTFLDHIVDGKTFAALGGNQSDMIKVSVYNRSEIIATRWPVK